MDKNYEALKQEYLDLKAEIRAVQGHVCDLSDDEFEELAYKVLNASRMAARLALMAH